MATDCSWSCLPSIVLCVCGLGTEAEKLRAACLQIETAPEKLLKRYEKRFEKREKRIRKTIRNVFENVLAPLRPLKKYFTGTFQLILKFFRRPKFAQKKVFFFHREALHP